MPPSSIQKYLNQFLSERLALEISSIHLSPVGGGSINDSYQVRINSNIRYFLKLNSITKYPSLFGKEKNGLEFLCQQKIILTPSVILCDELDDRQVLLLEWIENGVKTEQFWNQFGEQLAKLHLVTNSHFGFIEDNYMGALPQMNKPHQTWIDFFIHCRLQPQIKIAKEKQLFQTKHLAAFENLYKKLSAMFNNEKPALLHGDLWSGNFICNKNSEPVLIDPAVYFGHRSMDLAMTTLFGGFDKQFYDSYNHHYPFPKNYHEQWQICNLYPLLIHLNLFGLGYLGQIENTLRKFS
jgi:protein-ribulosamine 3-kinase